MPQKRRRIALIMALGLAMTLAAGPAGAGNESVDPRIVGGTEVSPPGAYPFMVAVVASGSDSYSGQFCGGSLIAPGWVMTAAHCVVDETAAGVDVVIGRHDLTTNAGERIGVRSIVLHPDYNDRTSANDIALLELKSASAFAPVVLPPDGTLDTAVRQVTITGWGDTQSKPRWPTELREVTVPIVSNADCTAAYGSSFKPSSMLCAGNLNIGGQDSCQGDSGGPLFVADGGGFIQLGIVSWGDECADPDFPGVYSRVSALAGWVTEVSGVVPGGGGAAPLCDGETATLWGTDEDDVLTGTDGRDVIVGLGGNDTIDAGGGDDLVCAGDGDDTVLGGAGADVLFGGDGDDRLVGGSGNDWLYGSSGNDRMFGRGGDDRLVGGDGNDIGKGGSGHDTIRGGKGDDTLWGGSDGDTIRGGSGADVLRGEGGDDSLFGSLGDDVLIGGAGIDWGKGGPGVDTCSVETPVSCE